MKAHLMTIGLALVAIFVANNVKFVRDIVGPRA